jgi:hypothetical protein
MLFAFALYSVPKTNLQPVLKIITLIIMLLLTVYTFNSSYFMREKLETHYYSQTEAFQRGEVTRGRFFGMFSSLKVALHYPVTGRNILSATNIEEEIGEGGAFGAGLPGIMARYGMIFAAIYIWFFYKGLKVLCRLNNFNERYALVFFIIINLGLLTQAFGLNLTIIMFFITGLLTPKEQLRVSKEIIVDYRQPKLTQ